MLRIMEYLSACLASNGSSSPIRIPSTLVGMGLSSGPQYSVPASGLGSKVSKWHGPPHIQIWITDLALAGRGAARADRLLPSASPVVAISPHRIASRRVMGGQCTLSGLCSINIGVHRVHNPKA